MALRNGGTTFTLIVVIVIAMAFGYILTSGGSSLYPTSTQYSAMKYSANINMWADANGWELKQGPAATSYDIKATNLINPILYYKADTLIYFNITEADGAPHDFTICYDGSNTSTLFSTITSGPSSIYSNPTKWENTGASYTIISVSQLTQNIGHTASSKYPFEKPGIYTYWCTVHPTEMYGLIIINGASSSS